MAHFNAHVLLFAVEWHWTPTQVWGLTYAEYCAMSSALDEEMDRRREQARKAKR